MNEDLVIVENVSKRFCRNLRKSLWYGVCDIASEFAPWKHHNPHVLRPGEFWANKDISFRLKRGECLGLIGRNGAGKTTLLKMLNGLIRPDQGRITMRGRVGALIALGAGFNPILTGRENIYVNGSVLGLSKKEIDKKIDEIIEFSGIEPFIDSPVQSYSSGMTVRLGFAIATAMEPDILILDEVLAVGDAAFRFKCSNRIRKLIGKCAVIFVSHSMEQIGEICSRGIVLRSGTVLMNGTATQAIEAYHTINDEKIAHRDVLKPMIAAPFTDIRIDDIESVPYSAQIRIPFEITSSQNLENVAFRVVFFSSSGAMVSEFNSRNQGICLSLVSGKNRFVLKISGMSLKPGQYQLDIHFNDADESYAFLARSFLEKELRITGSINGHAATITGYADIYGIE